MNFDFVVTRAGKRVDNNKKKTLMCQRIFLVNHRLSTKMKTQKATTTEKKKHANGFCFLFPVCVRLLSARLHSKISHFIQDDARTE